MLLNDLVVRIPSVGIYHELKEKVKVYTDSLANKVNLLRIYGELLKICRIIGTGLIMFY